LVNSSFATESNAGKDGLDAGPLLVDGFSEGVPVPAVAADESELLPSHEDTTLESSLPFSAFTEGSTGNSDSVDD